MLKRLIRRFWPNWKLELRDFSDEIALIANTVILKQDELSKEDILEAMRKIRREAEWARECVDFNYDYYGFPL